MSSRAKALLLLGATVALALVLRAWTLDVQSFSMDEAAVFRDLRLPWLSLVELEDSFPPLYLLLLKGWSSWFPGDLAARWLSVFVGLAAVPALWLAGKEIAGERTAALAAALLAVSAFHVFYSQTVRPYALYFTLAAWALWLFIRGARHNDLWAWLGFAVVCALGVFTHYYFALLVAVSFIALAAVRGSDAYTAEALIAYLTVTVLALITLPLLETDLAYQTSIRPPRPLGPAAFGYTWYAMLTGFALGPSKTDIYMLDAATVVRQALPWMVGITALLIAPLARGVQALGRTRVGMLVVLAIGPVLVAGALGYALDVTYNVRFVNWCLIPILLLVAAGAASENAGILTRASVAGLIAVQLVALVNQTTEPRYHTEDMRGVAGYLMTHASPANPVFTCSDYMHKPLRHYLKTPWRVEGTPPRTEIFTDRAQADAEVRRLAREVRRDGTFWLVYSRPFHGDPDGHLLQALSETSDLVIQEEFAGTRLYRGTFPRSFTLAGN